MPEPILDPKRYFGKYRALVKDVQDPEKLGRVKCQVPEVLGSLLTDWAWPCGAWYGGTEDSGDFRVPEAGATVFVEFESGSVQRPLYTSVWWGKPKGKNHVPKLAREEKDESASEPRTDVTISAAGGAIQQPASAYAAKYPLDRKSVV